jgi:hypothetical protein
MLWNRFVSRFVILLIGSLFPLSAQQKLPQPIATTRAAITTAESNLGYPEPFRIEANPQKGFWSAYYLFLPTTLRKGLTGEDATLLIIPNNTGKVSDDMAVHDKSALRDITDWRRLATSLHVGLLMPVFPRPAYDDLIYTHALSRTAMEADEPQLHRLDLQLIHMIDDARSREKNEHIRFHKRVLMFGFSASGMFVNRFVFMHPDRVQAATIGSPGGWAIAPVSKWKGNSLPYPIGVADFRAVTGQRFRLKRVAQVPQLLYMGTADQNDSVVFHDSYDEQSKELIFSLFGDTLMSRWPRTVELYGTYLPKVELKLYPEAGHQVTNDMVRDCEIFLRQYSDPIH